MTQEINHLKELSGSKYEIVDGEPDIRKWEVQIGQQEKIGKVSELLFDENSRRVRYIIVKTDSDHTGSDEDRKVLIPIGVASLHKENDEVLLPGITSEQIASLPEYHKDKMDAGTERVIRNIFEGSALVGLTDTGINTDADQGNDFYDHEHFNEDRLYQNRTSGAEQTIPIIKENVSIGKRLVETGGVALQTSIVEVPVEETVQLREEHVSVERKAVDKPLKDADFDTFQEGTIELTEYAEVPLITKEARVVEEVTFKKEVEEVDQTVRETVRETKVEVEQLNKKI